MEFANSGIELSKFSIFYLREYIRSTFSKRVGDVYDVLYRIARRWSVDFAVQKILNVIVSVSLFYTSTPTFRKFMSQFSRCLDQILMNPCLDCHQQPHLKLLLTRALDQLLWPRALDPRVMRGLVALACPNLDTTILFGYLMEINTGMVSDNSTLEVDSKSNIVVETETLCTLQIPHENARVAQSLCRNYSLEQFYAAAMPSPVRRSVLAALKGSMEVPLLGSGFLDASPQSFQHTAPICCITLEPLLRHNGTIAPDVVAVIQRSAILSKQHAFLY